MCGHDEQKLRKVAEGIGMKMNALYKFYISHISRMIMKAAVIAVLMTMKMMTMSIETFVYYIGL